MRFINKKRISCMNFVRRVRLEFFWLSIRSFHDKCVLEQIETMDQQAIWNKFNRLIQISDMCLQFITPIR